MILDTSAIVSILNDEDDAALFAAAIEAAPVVAASAGTILEAALVLGRTRGATPGRLPEPRRRVGGVCRQGAPAVGARGLGSATDAAADRVPGSTTATASPTPRPASRTSRCCSRATTSPIPTSLRHSERRGEAVVVAGGRVAYRGGMAGRLCRSASARRERPVSAWRLRHPAQRVVEGA